MEVSKYKIIQATSAQELQALVNEAIREGWQPYGSIAFDGMQYVQPMVLEDNKRLAT